SRLDAVEPVVRDFHIVAHGQQQPAEALSRVAVVLNHQHPPHRLPSSLGGSGRTPGTSAASVAGSRRPGPAGWHVPPQKEEPQAPGRTARQGGPATRRSLRNAPRRISDRLSGGFRSSDQGEKATAPRL